MWLRHTNRALMRIHRPTGRYHNTILSMAMGTLVNKHITVRYFSGSFSSSLQTPEVTVKLHEVMDAFAEARELISDAKESVGTTYFEEDIQDAKEQTEKTLQLWDELQNSVKSLGDTDALERLRKEHDVKLGQLRAELEDAEHADGGED